MSGFEVAGLILAIFPLMISGMEHYESTKKTTITWWKIKRAHRRDRGKLDIVRIEYRYVLMELLEPLLLDGTLTKSQREGLLNDPSGSGWQEPEVQDALEERLGNAKLPFLDVLRELDCLLVELADATKVTDPQFQDVLRKKAVRVPS